MAVTPSYREYVADQLAAIGAVVIKRMFGGVGLWCQGAMFGLIDDDTLYLRVDDTTRPEFVQRKMPALRPVKSQPTKVSENYYQLPGEVLEDSEELVVWAKRAIRAANSPTAAATKRAAKATKKPLRATKKSTRRSGKN
jgi:DNA transformation protein and related proteins